jgi:uncharacterized protein
VKTFAAFVLLWVAPLALGQNKAIDKPPPTKTEPVITQSPAPAKTQEPASKALVKVDPEKEAVIRKLFEIQGARSSMGQVLAGISENMKPMLSKKLPPGEYQDKLIPLFFEKFQSKIKMDDLMDLMVPIYDRYLTKEDINGLAQFYQTPLGKKIISVLPQLAIETQTAAMNMGQELGRQAMMEVLSEHPDLQKALEEAGARKK